MAFFLIVPSIMVVSIMSVHALAKRLGLKIFYSTLVAVALLSFMIIFAATVLSPVPGRRFLLYLGGLILSTSFLLTLVNNFLVRKQREEEKIFTEQVKAAYAEELKKDTDKPIVEEIPKPVDKFEWSNETPLPEETDEQPESKKIIQLVDNPDLPEEFPLENVFKPLDDVKAEAVAKALENKDAEPFEEPKPEENFLLQDAFKPLVAKALENKDAEPFEEPKPEENFLLQDAFKPLEVKSEKIPDNESDKPFEEPKPEENFPLQETFKPLEEVKPDMLKKIQPEVESSATVEEIDRVLSEEISKPAQIVEEKVAESAPVVEEKVAEPAPVIEEKVAESAPVVEEKVAEPAPVVEEKVAEPAPVVEEKVAEPAPVIEEETSKPAQDGETLDNILDKAYDARAKGRIWVAIENYKKALDRYGSDEYAPFVAIDLGNIYKENALYAKAIKTYEAALNLPAVKRNEATKKEFVKNLEYLRVVRDILLKHRALTTPFAKIPKEILQEIDAEFQKAQLRSRNINKF